MFKWWRRNPTVSVDPELEGVAKEYRELQNLGTGIALDRDGFSPEQIELYFRRTREIEAQYGSRLQNYMKARHI